MKIFILLLALLFPFGGYSKETPQPVKATVKVFQVLDDGDVIVYNITTKKTTIKVPRTVKEHDSSLGGSLRTKPKKNYIKRVVYDDKVILEEIVGTQMHVIVGMPTNAAFDGNKLTGFFVRDGVEKLSYTQTTKTWVILTADGIAASEEKGKVKHLTVPKYRFTSVAN